MTEAAGVMLLEGEEWLQAPGDSTQTPRSIGLPTLDEEGPAQHAA
jgi:hypothetical protein